MTDSEIRPRRSLLFVPGLRPDRFGKALESGADIVCIDIEDAVPLPRKQEARDLTFPLFAETKPVNVETMVRINPLSTPDGLRDILALRDCEAPPGALMLAKPGSAEEIRLYDELLRGNCAHIRFHVIIESTDGLANVMEIASASPRIDSLLFGAVDMSADLRAAKTWETLFYAVARRPCGGPIRSRSAGRPLSQPRRSGRAGAGGACVRCARIYRQGVDPSQAGSCHQRGVFTHSRTG